MLFAAPPSASRYNNNNNQQQQQQQHYHHNNNIQQYQTQQQLQQQQQQHHNNQYQQQYSSVHQSPDRNASPPRGNAAAVGSTSRNKSATAASNSTSATSTSHRNNNNNNNSGGGPPRFPQAGGAGGLSAAAYNTGGGSIHSAYATNGGMVTPRGEGGAGSGRDAAASATGGRNPNERVLEVPPEGMDSHDEHGNPITYIEVPVVEEVVRHVPVCQEVVVEKYQPKVEIEWVDKIVQVPEIRYTDRPVDVPVVEEVVKHVTRKEVVEVPREIVKHVPKVETVVIEKIVEVPGEVIEVPKPYVVENKIPVPVVIDQQVPVLVAQIIQPVITGVSEHSRDVPVINYKPNVHIVDIPVARPIKSCLVNNGVLREECQVVQVPPGQYNTLLRHLNRHLDVPERSSFIPYISDPAGAIVFADEFCPPGGPIAVPMPLINSPAPAAAGASINAPVVPGYDPNNPNPQMLSASRSVSRRGANKHGGGGGPASSFAGSIPAFPSQAVGPGGPAALTARDLPAGRRRNSHRSEEPGNARRPLTERLRDRESSRQRRNNAEMTVASRAPPTMAAQAHSRSSPERAEKSSGWLPSPTAASARPPQWAQKDAAVAAPTAYRAQVTSRGGRDDGERQQQHHSRNHHPHHRPERQQQRREVREEARRSSSHHRRE